MRPRGGIIGATVQPEFTKASGIWSLRESSEYRAAGKWPIPGLICNLDASVLSSLRQNSNGTTAASATNDAVGYWADQSGNGNHATQATSDQRPTLQLSNQNGLPGVQTDGVNDYLQASISGFNTLASATIVLVAKTALAAAPDTETGRFWFFGNFGSASSPYPQDRGVFLSHATSSLIGEKILVGVVNPGVGNGRIGVSSYSRAANTAQVLSTTLSNSGTSLLANNVTQTFDLATTGYSASTSTSPADIGYTVDNILLLNASRSSGIVQFFNTVITYHQMLIFNRTLTTQEQTDIWNELRAKWAIS